MSFLEMKFYTYPIQMFIGHDLRGWVLNGREVEALFVLHTLNSII